ncbi:MAG: hypothetical protein A2X40_07645 [Elusimicrobia bacterium GWC2_65_9]|nr:MAG: hypothetical protein A2X40_07645 [Elusimicrobia bacterium GWC2_65_9]
MNWQTVARQIKGREKEHQKLIVAVLRADGGNIFPLDLIAVGVIKRSLMLLQGFLSMLRSGNYLCAGPLLRMQLDNVLRIYAAGLFPSGSDALKAFLEDRPLSQLKAPDGKPLTDKELTTRVGRIYPWLPQVYTTTSGFVHFSRSAIMSTVEDLTNDGAVRVVVGPRGGRRWKSDERLAAAQAFDEATKAVLQMGYSWGHVKTVEGAKRSKFAARAATEGGQHPFHTSLQAGD